MVVKVRLVGPMGHQSLVLSLEEAQKLVHKKSEQHYVVDFSTKQVLQDLNLEDGQELTLIPKIAGGAA